jgi:hypothetical protein
MFTSYIASAQGIVADPTRRSEMSRAHYLHADDSVKLQILNNVKKSLSPPSNKRIKLGTFDFEAVMTAFIRVSELGNFRSCIADSMAVVTLPSSAPDSCAWTVGHSTHLASNGS